MQPDGLTPGFWLPCCSAVHRPSEVIIPSREHLGNAAEGMGRGNVDFEEERVLRPPGGGFGGSTAGLKGPTEGAGTRGGFSPALWVRDRAYPLHRTGVVLCTIPGPGAGEALCWNGTKSQRNPGLGVLAGSQWACARQAPSAAETLQASTRSLPYVFSPSTCQPSPLCQP